MNTTTHQNTLIASSTLVSSSHLVLIPSYNPGSKVYETVKSARQYWNPVWVVVDGSNDGSPEGLRALALVPLPDFDESRFLKRLQVAAQVTIRQSTQIPEFAEHEAVLMCQQRREDSQPRFLVQNAVDAVEGVAAGFVGGCWVIRHGHAPGASKESRQLQADRC